VNSQLTTIFVSFCTELIRNMVGFFLVATGVLVICLGAHWHMDVMVTLGTATLIPAAMLALQSKRTPEGNTTTTQVTVPPPLIADAPIAPPATPPMPVVTGIERETAGA
jgi:hypothetical protein